jgi:hypothetical protein
MTTLTSTVPGCIAALTTHLNTVASDNSSLNIGIYTGLPIETLKDNFIMIGDYNDGKLIEGYAQDWRGFPAVAERKSEAYALPCSLRAWSGNSDPVSRITDAFTMMDAVMGQLQGDPQGTVNGGYPLTPSGSWQVTSIDMPTSGPLGGAGWGVVLTFLVDVINVYLTS